MHHAPPQAGALGFSTPILLSGKTTTEGPISEDIATSLNAGKRPFVRATINGQPYRTTVRATAGVEAGYGVEVSLEPEGEPRTSTVPPELVRAVANDLGAHDVLNTLSNADEQRFVLSVERARTDGTRQRRTRKAVAALREERA